nr:hypothetical protein [uncultured Roseovarius sp.]
MKVPILLVTLALSLFLCQAQVGQAEGVTEVALQKSDFKEFLREGADISGAVVVGVQVQTAAPDGPSLMGYIPQAWKGSTICAQVVSVDGRYEAYGPYLVPDDWPGGTTPLEFPTKYQDQLRALPADGVGALVSQGDCGGQQGASTVALWNSTSLETIDVMVNSFRADDVFAYIADRPQPVRCQKINTESRIAFDSKCSIDARDIHGATKIGIYRITGGKPSQPTEFDLWFPAIR